MRVLTDESPEFWATYHRGFMAEAANALERFRANAGDVLTLDGSVESLDAVEDWLVSRLRHPVAEWDSLEWIPVWLMPGTPLARSAAGREGRPSRAHLEAMDEVHGYLVHVLMTQRPGATWMIFKGERRDMRRGSTMLDIGRPKWPVDTMGLLRKPAMAVTMARDAPAAGWLRRAVADELAKVQP